MMKRLLPPKLFFLSILMMLGLHFMFPITRLIGPPLSWAGLLFFGGGLGLAIGGSRLFAKVKTNIKTFNKPNELVTEGLFRYSRNPMYLGFVLALFGVAILLGSLTPFIVWLAFIIITDRWYIAFEEQMMLENFGERYQAYQAATRRWL